MNYNMISKETLKQLDIYINNLIPESKKYKMPRGSTIINNNILLNSFNKDEKLLNQIINIFGEEVLIKQKINFDQLILDKKILFNVNFIKMINPLIIELYFSSEKVQSILTNITNTLLSKDASIVGENFFLTNEVLKNFKN